MVNQKLNIDLEVNLELQEAYSLVDKHILDLWQQKWYTCATGSFYRQLVVDCSVPQGLVLGPLKFVVYTEDLPAVIEHHHVDHDLYADDTQLSDHPSISSVAESIANIKFRA